MRPPGATDSSAGRGLATAALVALTAALSLTPITNNDIFLHLRTGGLILDTGRVPHVDDYSALARGRPFVAHEWLAGVIFAAVERIGGAHGPEALVLLKAALAIATILVLAGVARTLGADAGIATACGAFVIFLAAARLLDRPHLFSYLLTAGVLAWLARRRARGAPPIRVRDLAPLFVLQVLWANLHGSFLLGPAIVLIAAFAAAAEGLLSAGADRRAALAEGRRLGLVAAGLVAASLVNPYGVALLRFPFELTGSAFMEQIYEWLPPYTEPFRSTYMAREYVAWSLLGLVAHALALRPLLRRRVPGQGLFPALLFAALFVLSLRMNRNVTDFALATLPGVAAALSLSARPPASGSRRRRVVAIAVTAVAIVVAVRGYPYAPGAARRIGFGLGAGIPVAAADYVADRGLEGNVFNTYSAGAYLVYRFHPRVRVAMDSRNDVYREDLWDEYRRACADAAGLERLLGRIDARFAFLEWPQQGMVVTARALRSLPSGWRPVYFDDVAAVYVETGGPYAALAARDGYVVLEPSLFRPGTWSPEEAGLALAEADRAVAAGGGAIARVMRIEALRTLGRRAEADREESALVDADPPLSHVHLLLALVHATRDERGPALDRARRAAALNPASDVARRLIDSLQGTASR